MDDRAPAVRHDSCPSPDMDVSQARIPLEKGQREERRGLIDGSYTPHREPRSSPMPLPYCSEQ